MGDGIFGGCLDITKVAKDRFDLGEQGLAFLGGAVDVVGDSSLEGGCPLLDLLDVILQVAKLAAGHHEFGCGRLDWCRRGC